MFRCTKPITTNDILSSRWRTLAIGAQYALARTRPDGGRHQPGRHLRAHRCLRSIAPMSSSTSRHCPRTWRARPCTTFSGFTMSVCQLQPDRAATCASNRGPARGTRDAAQLSVDASTTAQRSSRASGSRASLPRPARWRPMSPANTVPDPTPRATTTCSNSRRNTAGTIFHPVGHVQDGAGGGSAGGRRSRSQRARPHRNLASSIAGSCRRWYPATPTAPAVMIAEKIGGSMILADGTR